MRRNLSALALGVGIFVACGGKDHVDVDILGDAAMPNPTGGGQFCGSCGGGQICLLNQCAMPCGQDRDCAAGNRCLRTTQGNGCVRSSQFDCSACTLGGTVCTGNECRTQCDFASGCASDQSCKGNACYGNDTSHDPRGGSGGGSGTGSGTTGAGGSGFGGSMGNVCDGIIDMCSHCACNSCPSDWQSCNNDPGCVAIGECARRTGCRQNCYMPGTCQGVIDSNGGPGSSSFTRAMSLANCSSGTCQGPCNLGAVDAGAPQSIGWWRFEEGGGNFTADASGHGHQGNLIGTPPWRTGISGSAIELDGVSQYVNINPGPVIGAMSTFTIEAWILWPGSPGLMTIYGEGGPSASIDFNLSDGYPQLILYGNNGGSLIVRSSRYVPTQSWHHVAGVVQPAGGATIYVDGQMASSNPANVAPSLPAGEASIGRQPGSGGVHYFGGIIDEVRIFSFARNSQEIFNDFSAMGRGP